MALKKGDIKNFETLQRAARDGVLALVESKDKETGEYRALICAVYDVDDGMKAVTPFGHMCTGNPYEIYADPTQENSDA